MHTSKSVIATLAFALVAPVLLASANASAEEEFDAKVDGAEVKIQTKGDWHINKEFPWRVVSGETKHDKARFRFEEKAFGIKDLPKGETRIVGGVCSASSCRRIETVVTVK